MSRKQYMYAAVTLGGVIGAYLPVWLFNDNGNGLSFWSVIGGLVGSLLGIFLVFKLDLGE